MIAWTLVFLLICDNRWHCKHNSAIKKNIPEMISSVFCLFVLSLTFWQSRVISSCNYHHSASTVFTLPPETVGSVWSNTRWYPHFMSNVKCQLLWVKLPPCPAETDELINVADARLHSLILGNEAGAAGPWACCIPSRRHRSAFSEKSVTL